MYTLVACIKCSVQVLGRVLEHDLLLGVLERAARICLHLIHCLIKLIHFLGGKACPQQLNSRHTVHVFLLWRLALLRRILWLCIAVTLVPLLGTIWERDLVALSHHVEHRFFAAEFVKVLLGDGKTPLLVRLTLLLLIFEEGCAETLLLLSLWII